MKRNVFYALFFGLLAGFSSSCNILYHNIDVETLDIDDQLFYSADSSIRIFVEYDILHGWESTKFYRMEQKRRMQLVALRIDNKSSSPLIIPDDLEFMFPPGVVLAPFELEMALDFYLKPDRKEKKKKAAGPYFEWPALELIVFTWKTGNFITETISINRFTDDLSAYYFEDYVLDAGYFIDGFLVITDKEISAIHIKQDTNKTDSRPLQ